MHIFTPIEGDVVVEVIDYHHQTYGVHVSKLEILCVCLLKLLLECAKCSVFNIDF